MNDGAGSVQLCALRVARLAADGTPDPGTDNLYVTDAMISLAADPEVEDGEEITEKNGCGKIMVDYKSPDVYRRLNITLGLAVPDPELIALITGNGSLLTSGGETVGYGYPRLYEAFPENGVSVEGWSKAILDGALAAERPYWRWVLPRVRNWRLGERTLEDGSTETTLEGHGIENPNWGDGPVYDWGDVSDDPLEGPMGYARDTEPPEAQLGYQELEPPPS